MGALRYCGQGLIALGLAVLALGAWLWLAGYDVTLPPRQLWTEIDADSLQAMLHHLPGWLARPVERLLDRPAWESLSILGLALLVPGGVLAWIGRRPARRRSFR